MLGSLFFVGSQPKYVNLEEQWMVTLMDEILEWERKRQNAAVLALKHPRLAERRRFRRTRVHFRVPRRWQKLGLTMALTLAPVACSTVHAAPPPPAPVVCSHTPIRALVVNGKDAKGNAVVGPVMALDTPICQCSDRIVRTCE